MDTENNKMTDPLLDAAAAEGRADVPDRPALVVATGRLRYFLNRGEILAQQGLEALERVRRNLDKLRAGHELRATNRGQRGWRPEK